MSRIGRIYLSHTTEKRFSFQENLMCVLFTTIHYSFFRFNFFVKFKIVLEWSLLPYHWWLPTPYSNHSHFDQFEYSPCDMSQNGRQVQMAGCKMLYLVGRWDFVGDYTTDCLIAENKCLFMMKRWSVISGDYKCTREYRVLSYLWKSTLHKLVPRIL